MSKCSCERTSLMLNTPVRYCFIHEQVKQRIIGGGNRSTQARLLRRAPILVQQVKRLLEQFVCKTQR